MIKFLLALVAALSMGWAVAAVNINTASAEELKALPGIGAAKAQAIVDYRKENGQFKTVDDLKKVKGIGDAVLAKLKDQATVGNAAPPKKAVPAKK
ncbi:helix-hairpin-helix domain-containing protein [Neisseria leonii]|uniref:Helix-hairpin-helix domain-containing protein n=1 Tax=Neisseria leonii TaxID=2995413 RepID=A0A9X4E8H1_9NEIS|nr:MULTISPECIES: helix-hairpin-helix domain-containing protein [unclassified Neisseria]MDD9324953.1 helix-hairpin-helix domain-containing protein [Neisseria sp. 3986]MDD9327488.1 helix-hairpin-helix domain-containing protein [Neisseria sp. 51.81]